MALFHIFNECPAVLIRVVNRLKQSGIRYLLLFQYCGVALFCKGICVQNLVTAAGCCGERDQDVRFPECKDLTDRVCACTGDNQVSCRK